MQKCKAEKKRKRGINNNKQNKNEMKREIFEELQ